MKIKLPLHKCKPIMLQGLQYKCFGYSTTKSIYIRSLERRHMCTGFSFFTKSKHHYLARTMDFAFEFNGIPTVVPRHYQYQFDLESELRLQYGFVGTNLKVGRYRFGDGINEHGVAISNHYFTGEASYSNHRRYGYFNLAPEEFIVWVLGFVKSIEELKQK